MSLYKKIKSFTEISPTTDSIGEYLKDACNVCDIYHQMVGIDGIEDYEQARIKETELDNNISKILMKWK